MLGLGSRRHRMQWPQRRRSRRSVTTMQGIASPIQPLGDSRDSSLQALRQSSRRLQTGRGARLRLSYPRHHRRTSSRSDLYRTHQRRSKATPALRHRKLHREHRRVRNLNELRQHWRHRTLRAERSKLPRPKRRKHHGGLLSLPRAKRLHRPSRAARSLHR